MGGTVVTEPKQSNIDGASLHNQLRIQGDHTIPEMFNSIKMEVMSNVHPQTCRLPAVFVSTLLVSFSGLVG